VSSIEPYRVKDALRDSDWVLAMQEELNNFMRNEVWHLVPCPNQNVVGTKWVFRDENGFGIFRYSKNRFRNFSIEFIGNGIFRKMESVFGIFYRKRHRNRRGVLPTVFFGYQFLSEITGFVSRNFPELCLEIFQNCVLEFFEILQHVIFRIACRSLDKDYLFLYFLDALRFFWDRWRWKAIDINDLVFSTH
jgi:hypothetical protein